MKAKITCIVNQKGGTGKTTTAINLGTALAMKGKKVLLIDLDPQGNLSYSFGITDNVPSMAEVLQGKQTLQAILVTREGLSIAPAFPSLSDVEVSLVNKIGRENVLKDALSEVKGFDYVFIDSPPSLSVLTVNALNTADEVLIPAQMEVLSLQGLTQLLNTVQEVKKVLNKTLKVRGIVPSMYDGRRRLSSEVLETIQTNLKEKVFKSHIRECVKIAEAPSFAKSVLSYAPHSNGATDFMGLANEFITN
jgi:chromosome partitioning protein